MNMERLMQELAEKLGKGYSIRKDMLGFIVDTPYTEPNGDVISVYVICQSPNDVMTVTDYGDVYEAFLLTGCKHKINLSLLRRSCYLNHCQLKLRSDGSFLLFTYSDRKDLLRKILDVCSAQRQCFREFENVRAEVLEGFKHRKGN